MRVTNRQLRAFSECPAYYKFSSRTRLIQSDQVKFVDRVLKKCCLLATETGWKADWRRVVGWVDKAVFSGVDIEKEEKFREARLLAERVLKPVQRWYGEHYLIMQSVSYVDLDLINHTGQHFVEASIPMVHLTKPVSMTLVTEIDESERKMYNNLEIRALAWLLDKELGCGQVDVNVLCVGPNGGLDTKVFTILSKAH